MATTAKNVDTSSEVESHSVVCNVPPSRITEFLALLKFEPLESGNKNQGADTGANSDDLNSGSALNDNTFHLGLKKTGGQGKICGHIGNIGFLSVERVLHSHWDLKFPCRNSATEAKKLLLRYGVSAMDVLGWALMTVKGPSSSAEILSSLPVALAGISFVRRVTADENVDGTSPKSPKSLSKRKGNAEQQNAFVVAVGEPSVATILKVFRCERGWIASNIRYHRGFHEFAPPHMHRFWLDRVHIILTGSWEKPKLQEQQKDYIFMHYLATRRFPYWLLNKDVDWSRYYSLDNLLKLRDSIADRQVPGLSRDLRLADRPAPVRRATGSMPLHRYGSSASPVYPLSPMRSVPQQPFLYSPYYAGFAPGSCRSLPTIEGGYSQLMFDGGLAYPSATSPSKLGGRQRSLSGVPSAKEVEEAAAEALVAAMTRHRRTSLNPQAPEYLPASSEMKGLSNSAREVHRQITRRRILGLCQEHSERGHGPILVDCLAELFKATYKTTLNHSDLDHPSLLNLLQSLAPYAVIVKKESKAGAHEMALEGKIEESGGSGEKTEKASEGDTAGAKEEATNEVFMVRYAHNMVPKIERFVRTIIVAFVVKMMQPLLGQLKVGSTDEEKEVSAALAMHYINELQAAASKKDDSRPSVSLDVLEKAWDDTLGVVLPLRDVFSIEKVSDLSELIGTCPELECVLDGGDSVPPKIPEEAVEDGEVTEEAGEETENVKVFLVADRVSLPNALSPDVMYSLSLLGVPVPYSRIASVIEQHTRFVASPERRQRPSITSYGSGGGMSFEDVSTAASGMGPAPRGRSYSGCVPPCPPPMGMVRSPPKGFGSPPWIPLQDPRRSSSLFSPAPFGGRPQSPAASLYYSACQSIASDLPPQAAMLKRHSVAGMPPPPPPPPPPPMSPLIPPRSFDPTLHRHTMPTLTPFAGRPLSPVHPEPLNFFAELQAMTNLSAKPGTTAGRAHAGVNQLHQVYEPHPPYPDSQKQHEDGAHSFQRLFEMLNKGTAPPAPPGGLPVRPSQLFAAAQQMRPVDVSRQPPPQHTQREDVLSSLLGGAQVSHAAAMPAPAPLRSELEATTTASQRPEKLGMFLAENLEFESLLFSHTLGKDQVPPVTPVSDGGNRVIGATPSLWPFGIFQQPPPLQHHVEDPLAHVLAKLGASGAGQFGEDHALMMQSSKGGMVNITAMLRTALSSSSAGNAHAL